jgi:hypothetical protein
MSRFFNKDMGRSSSWQGRPQTSAWNSPDPFACYAPLQYSLYQRHTVNARHQAEAPLHKAIQIHRGGPRESEYEQFYIISSYPIALQVIEGKKLSPQNLWLKGLSNAPVTFFSKFCRIEVPNLSKGT